MWTAAEAGGEAENGDSPGSEFEPLRPGPMTLAVGFSEPRLPSLGSGNGKNTP